MEKKFDLTGLLKACNYSACRIGVTKIGESCANDLYEVKQESEPELYEMLFLPDTDGVEYIRANYCHVEWNFFDKDGMGQIIYQLRIEYDVEEDSLHFHYDRFNLKTKYTLINILKSQSEWHHIGIAMYNNDTEDIVADSWFDEYDTEDDTWIHAFEDLCDEWEVNSRHASLFKGQEEENGKTVDVLDIVIDTETDYECDDSDEEDNDDESHNEDKEKNENDKKQIRVVVEAEHILKLPLEYYTYEGNQMAFAMPRHKTNYVTERLLALNLQCFGEYEIVGYSTFNDGKYDVYHTNLPKERFIECVGDDKEIGELGYDNYYYNPID